jgi:hypothetical protein
MKHSANLRGCIGGVTGPVHMCPRLGLDRRVRARDEGGTPGGSHMSIASSSKARTPWGSEAHWKWSRVRDRILVVAVAVVLVAGCAKTDEGLGPSSPAGDVGTNSSAGGATTNSSAGGATTNSSAGGATTNSPAGAGSTDSKGRPSASSTTSSGSAGTTRHIPTTTAGPASTRPIPTEGPTTPDTAELFPTTTTYLPPDPTESTGSTAAADTTPTPSLG